MDKSNKCQYVTNKDQSKRGKIKCIKTVDEKCLHQWESRQGINHTHGVNGYRIYVARSGDISEIRRMWISDVLEINVMGCLHLNVEHGLHMETLI